MAVAALAIGFAPALLIPVAALWAAGGLDSQGTAGAAHQFGDALGSRPRR